MSRVTDIVSTVITILLNTEMNTIIWHYLKLLHRNYYSYDTCLYSEGHLSILVKEIVKEIIPENSFVISSQCVLFLPLFLDYFLY